MIHKIDERQDRINKLGLLKQTGVNPYPAKAVRDFTIEKLLEKFDSLSGKEFHIVGRLRNIREHGNLIFADLQDGTGKIQLVLNAGSLSEQNFSFFQKFIDSGDFIEVKGKTFLTQRGQRSVEILGIKLLTKALRPIPTEYFGLQDEEEKLRRRYLDILLNPEVKELISKKEKFWNSMRKFLKKNGFLEVETPVLENTTGGADALPFITHHNALDIDIYLRISCGELWQKRLMVAGFEKTFEIGRIFRNEGISAEHAQDYTQMEFYWAYANYEDGMKLVKKMYQYVAKETFGTLKFKIGEWGVDLGGKWQKYDFVKTIKKFTGVDVLKNDVEQIRKKLNELKIEYDQNGFNLTRAIDNLWKYCRKDIAGPGFLVNVPVTMEPLAKRDEKNPDVVQRFQVILAGSEMGKGYSELNDPLDQAERFAAQQKLREQGDEEAQMFDHEFVEALEYGMPPTCGFGVSERLFSFLADKSIRECQAFPLLRPKDTEKERPQKADQTNIAVAIINKGIKLERWQEMNTVAHLNAAFGARKGKKLLFQDAITTKDGKDIKLNIQHAIMIKEAKFSQELIELAQMAKEKELEVAEFTREMLETTDDKKVIKNTAAKNLDEVEYLGVLVYGRKSVVEASTAKFSLYK